MKITKQHLKQLIKEEFEDMPIMDTDVFASQKGLDLEMIRTLACTKLGQAALVAMAEKILDDPTNIEEAIKPLAHMANVDVAALVDTIRDAPIPDALIPGPLKIFNVKTVGAVLDLLGNAFFGAGIATALKPLIGPGVEMVCSLDTLEENKLPKRTSTMKITKQQLKKIVKEELQNTLKEQDTEKYFKVYSMFEDYAEAHGQKMADAMTFKMSHDAFQKSRSGGKMTEREGALANAFIQRLKKVLAWKKSGGKKPTPETKPMPGLEKKAEDWDGLRAAYYLCRNKANKGHSPVETKNRVKRHIAKAKTMPNGFKTLVAYVEKRYPGCYGS